MRGGRNDGFSGVRVHRCVWWGGFETAGPVGGNERRFEPSVTSSAMTSTATSTTSSAMASRPHRKPRPAPGSLPQTHQLPPQASAAFRSEMAALWAGVRTGALTPALSAFFPKGAYAQVKAIADPGADYEARLIGEYRLDLAAAHALLGAGARHAALLGVDVPESFAHWVPPGACLNRIGYYEVPNSRLVYKETGQMRSVGIASLISWRGVWYVVHLGARHPIGRWRRSRRSERRTRLAGRVLDLLRGGVAVLRLREP